MVEHRKLAASFSYAFEGIWFALRYNQNLRVHFLIALFVIFAGIFFGVTPFEMGILGIIILLVICAEMVNTSIEEMVDFIVLEHRKEAKSAKDVAAGMVLLTAIGSVIIGGLIFTPYILKFLHL